MSFLRDVMGRWVGIPQIRAASDVLGDTHIRRGRRVRAADGMRAGLGGARGGVVGVQHDAVLRHGHGYDGECADEKRCGIRWV